VFQNSFETVLFQLYFNCAYRFREISPHIGVERRHTWWDTSQWNGKDRCVRICRVALGRQFNNYNRK